MSAAVSVVGVALCPSGCARRNVCAVSELVRVHVRVPSCVVWSELCVQEMGMAPTYPFIECLLCAQHFI